MNQADRPEVDGHALPCQLIRRADLVTNIGKQITKDKTLLTEYVMVHCLPLGRTFLLARSQYSQVRPRRRTFDCRIHMCPLGAVPMIVPNFDSMTLQVSQFQKEKQV